jgi:Transmembrane secretion effector
VDVTPLRLDRDFRYWWSGQLVSGVGNQATRMALRYQVYVATGSVVAVGGLTIVQLLAVTMFALAGGAIADAFDRRRVLMVAQLGMGATSIALWSVAQLAAPPLALVFGLAFVGGGLGAVDVAVRGSAIPRLVPRSRLPAAIALNQLNGRAAGIIGPSVGGMLIAAVDVQGVYALDALTFIASLLTLAAMSPIRPAGPVQAPGLTAIRDGLRFALHHRLILSVLLIDLAAVVFGMPTSLFPALALDVFRVGPVGFGFLGAAPAAGALVAALLSGWVGAVRRTGRALGGAVGVWGLAITAFGLLTFSFPLAWLALATAGGADVIASVLRTTIVQLETPDDMRGRVTSIYSMSAMSGSRLGDVEAAGVAALTGPQFSVVSGGLACLAGALIVLRAFPELGRHRISREQPTSPALLLDSGPADR